MSVYITDKNGNLIKVASSGGGNTGGAGQIILRRWED